MDRRQGVDSVVRALRRVNFQGSIFGQSVAIRLGLSESDVDALELLVDAGAATAGKLAEVMGLTTGAVTRVIDRLEQAGYVRRVADPADRRRVIVEIVPEKIATLESMMASLEDAAASEVGRYSPEQLALINEFLTRMADLTQAESARLRHDDGRPDGRDGPGRARGRARRTRRARVSRSARARRTCGSARAAPPRSCTAASSTGPRRRSGSATAASSSSTGGSRSTGASGPPPSRSTPRSLVGRADRRDRAHRGGPAGPRHPALRADRRDRPHAARVRHASGRAPGEADRRDEDDPCRAAWRRPLRLRLLGGHGQVQLDDTSYGKRGGEAVIESRGWSTARDRISLEVVGGSKSITVIERR